MADDIVQWLDGLGLGLLLWAAKRNSENGRWFVPMSTKMEAFVALIPLAAAMIIFIPSQGYA